MQTKKNRLKRYLETGTRNNAESKDAMEILIGQPLSIANVIKAHRQSENWSQQHLAGKLKVSKQAISRFENGELIPSLETAAKIAKVFGVDEETFIELTLEQLVKKAGLSYRISLEKKAG